MKSPSDTLKQSGLKSTKHRTQILKALEESDRPIAAEELYHLLTEETIAINISTVYRVLETLVQKNLVKTINLSNDNRVLYEYNRKTHSHYVVCLGCKKLMSIKSCPLEEYEREIEEKTHFKVIGHKLDLYGYCPDCLKKGLDKKEN